MPRPKVGSNNAIWMFAGLYFACYVPFTGLTKALSNGSYPGTDGVGVAGVTLLPISTAVSLVVSFAFITVMGWWKYAGRRRILGVSVPFPSLGTALSGVSTAFILMTTTLAYTFDGVSIVFMMLLMRGGVLIIAPIVDSISGRKTRWFSWLGLALSMLALVVAFSEKGGYELTVLAMVDILVYLASYFVRLRLMSSRAKSEDTATTLKYFVEEQLMTAPFALLLLAVLAAIGQGAFMEQIREGFTAVWDSGLLGETALIGLLSQGVGIFGTMILLDKRENTFSVPVNRCSSILAGVVASLLLALILDTPIPSGFQLAGAGLVVSAILVLSLAPIFARKRAERDGDSELAKA